MIRTLAIVLMCLCWIACSKESNPDGSDGPVAGSGGTIAEVTYDELASRTEGVAPLSVFFHADLGQGDAAREEFRVVHVEWDFGDPDSGTYITGHSKNHHVGPVAAHVFESAGTYEVKSNITYSDGTTEMKSVVVDVDEPDEVFSGESTVCVSQGGDFSDAPEGCLEVTTSDYAELGSHVAPGTRILLRRGETWTALAPIEINVEGPGHIGSFGEGDLPVIETEAQAFLLSAANPVAEDWRVTDLRLVGTSDESVGLQLRGQADHILALRIQGDALHVGVLGSGSQLVYWNENGNGPHSQHDGVAIVECDVRNIIGGGGGNGVFLVAQRLAFLGNYFRDSTAAEHIVRLPTVLAGVIAYNDLGVPAPIKHVIKLHAPDFVGNELTAGKYTERVQISDNLFQGQDEDWLVTLSPQNSDEIERLRDIIVERNEFHTTAETQVGLHISSAQQVTVRNNLFFQVNSRAFSAQGGVEGHTVSDIDVYNNTCFGLPGGQARLGSIAEDVPESAVVNNLVVSFDQEPDLEGSSEVDNLATRDAVFTSETPQSAADFLPALESAADNTGVPLPGLTTDFFGNLRSTSTPDLGAFEN
jgi:hypothetical protein